MRVGSIEIVPLLDGVARIPAGELLRYRGPVEDPWTAHRDLLEEDGSLELALGAFLVRTGSRLVLVDAGVGRLHTGPFRGGALLESLAASGVTPEEVTDVAFTHLHFDHVGWATRRGEIVFPRATYRCHPDDWHHFVERPEADPGAVRKLAPLRDRLEPFTDGTTFAPGVTVRHAPGHTPGSAVVVVADGAARALLLGDVAHCPIELLDDEWEFVGDVDPRLAARTREALAAEMEGSGVPMTASHFPGMRFGRLLAGEGRRSWVSAGSPGRL